MFERWDAPAYAHSLAPFEDFALISALAPQDQNRLQALGFSTQELGGPDNRHHLLSRTAAIGARLHVFSGYAFGDELLSNAAAATRQLDRRGFLNLTGNYACVRTEPERGLLIESDAFGLSVLYVYRAGRRYLVSNRLHLAIHAARALGWPLTPHEPSLLLRLYPHHVGQQPSQKQVFFEEITLLPADENLRAKNGALFSERKPRERHRNYRDAIRAAHDAILAQVRLTCADDRPVIFRLSGGWDSRIVYGALLKAGLLDAPNVFCSTSPELKDDFRVVCGLVNRFGGKFSESRLWLRHTAAQDLDVAFARYRSWMLGTYSSNAGFGARYHTGFGPESVAMLAGGGGECFRDFYFPSKSLLTPTRLERTLEKVISEHAPPLRPLAAELARGFRKGLLAERGLGVRRRLNRHYLDYRNRFHFGCPQLSDSFYSHPLMQPALLDAVRLASRSEVRDGRIVFDLQSAFCEELPHLPFDKPEKAFSTRTLPFDTDPRAYAPIEIPVEPVPAGFDAAAQQAHWLSAFHAAFDSARNHPIYRRAYSEELRQFILQRSGSAFYQWTSSVIATADLLSLASATEHTQRPIAQPSPPL